MVIVLLGCSFITYAQEDVADQKVVGSKALPVPDHEIEYEETLSPVWKKNWDIARELYRSSKFKEALIQYELLLSEKGNVNEARWEYVTILLYLERWQSAGEQLERLTAAEPDNMDYSLAQARVEVEIGRIDLAFKIYEQLYKASPGDTWIVQVLEGLIMTLKLQQRGKESIPYLEQLITLQPDELELQMELAAFAIEQGQLGKAKKILNRLEQNRGYDRAVLLLLAYLQEKLGNFDAAAGYWQQLVSIDADNSEAHDRLYRYYRDKEIWAMSLKHVELLLKKTPSDPGLLEAAADLNARMGRVDKTLEYYEYILVLLPTNQNILKKKKLVQRQLAKDLVVLVENAGSQQLWQDLVKVTADRPGVYREIADLLREKGKFNELIEVLALMVEENPHDEKTFKELTLLLKEKGRDRELRVLMDESKVRGKTVDSSQ